MPLFGSQKPGAKNSDDLLKGLGITRKQIQMVQRSWAKVVPIAPKVAELFYGRLFSEHPETRELFPNPNDMYQQGFKLMMMMTKVAYGLNNIEHIVPAAQESGRKHVLYGVKADDYPKVASALLWTLEQGLGAAWNDELKAAWTAAYTVLATTMIEAAEKVAYQSREC